jgi:hypothetical protein
MPQCLPMLETLACADVCWFARSNACAMCAFLRCSATDIVERVMETIEAAAPKSEVRCCREPGARNEGCVEFCFFCRRRRSPPKIGEARAPRYPRMLTASD